MAAQSVVVMHAASCTIRDYVSVILHFVSYAANIDQPIESLEDSLQLCELGNTNVEVNTESAFECLEASCNKYEEEVRSKDDGEENITKKVCIICDKEFKHYKGQKVKVSSFVSRESIDAFLLTAKEYNDGVLINKINFALDEKKWMYYHNLCKRNCINAKGRAMVKEQTPKTSWHKKRDLHKIAFEKVCEFIEEFIIKKRKCRLLSQLDSIHKDAYDSAAKESVADDVAEEIERFRSHFEEKLLKHYPKSITMVTENNSKVCKPYSGVLIQDYDIGTLEKEDKLQKAAIILRDECSVEICPIQRRTFDAILPQLEEYAKRPKLVGGLCSADDSIHAITPRNLQLFHQLNFSWLTSHFLEIPNTPMWVGFNSLVLQDLSHMQ
ncbi:hypothetical protein PV327_008733 [Microctonus hyperodae]|uniref:Uncharacterized protein n=1 Tax=Microctonus hyperodae TaxID=165561 RepID=A0AA39FSD1_MICHY|nr:hypothetical protein PV327_008733 [Microctonus hyperodae]